MNQKELTWQQQVEYRRIHKWGLDFNRFFRLRKVWYFEGRAGEYSNAQEVLNDL